MRSAVVGVLTALDLTVHECSDVSAADRYARRVTAGLVLADLDLEWDATCAGGFTRWCAGLPSRVRVIALAASARTMPQVPVGCHVLEPAGSAASLAQLVARAIARPRQPPVLTERQREVLVWVARGATNYEIGHALLITTGTVKRHLHDAYTALGARSRVEAVAHARFHGLI